MRCRSLCSRARRAQIRMRELRRAQGLRGRRAFDNGASVMTAPYTHENYIHAVRDIAAALIPDAERAVLYETKLVYGAGSSNTRGVTYYKCWRNGHPTDSHPFVEICAFGESDPVQIAGTTIHELGHVLAGMGTGHGSDWKAACERLGLRQFQAAGTSYSMANFA